MNRLFWCNVGTPQKEDHWAQRSSDIWIKPNLFQFIEDDQIWLIFNTTIFTKLALSMWAHNFTRTHPQKLVSNPNQEMNSRSDRGIFLRNKLIISSDFL